jgi:hypothetical protein
MCDHEKWYSKGIMKDVSRQAAVAVLWRSSLCNQPIYPTHTLVADFSTTCKTIGYKS